MMSSSAVYNDAIMELMATFNWTRIGVIRVCTNGGGRPCPFHHDINVTYTVQSCAHQTHMYSTGYTTPHIWSVVNS